MKHFARMFTLAVVAVGLSGCAEVKPWQRALLARGDMVWQPDAGESSLRTQIFYSKEASLAGGSAGGGGCGCN